jgi:Lrp/AsnC family leucine-responsive transcriptional regulator
MATTHELLKALMTDGRITWAALAHRVGLTPPAVAERVRRLEEAGTVRGYAALVDPVAAGCPLTAFVSVALDRPEHRVAFLERVTSLDEVQECHHVAGDYDYLLKIRCGGVQDLDRVISDEVKEVPGVVRTYTSVVLRTVKETPVLPLTNLPGPA